MAREHEVVPRVTPRALATAPEGIEETTLTIADATFETEQILLQEDEPTVLTVVNRHNGVYGLGSEQLVDGEPIAAATTTRVSFTTPEVGAYAGHLLEATSDTVALRCAWSSKRPAERSVPKYYSDTSGVDWISISAH